MVVCPTYFIDSLGEIYQCNFRKLIFEMTDLYPSGERFRRGYSHQQQRDLLKRMTSHIIHNVHLCIQGFINVLKSKDVFCLIRWSMGAITLVLQVNLLDVLGRLSRARGHFAEIDGDRSCWRMGVIVQWKNFPKDLVCDATHSGLCADSCNATQSCTNDKSWSKGPLSPTTQI